MIAHGKEIKVFAGNSNPALAKEICSELFMGLGSTAVSQFADGECSISVYEPVRGKDVFIVQSTCKSVNDNLMALHLDALGFLFKGKKLGCRFLAVNPVNDFF